MASDGQGSSSPQGLPWAKIAVALAIFQALVISALETFVLVNVQLWLNRANDGGTASIIVVYFGLFIFAQIFQALLALDAAKYKNTMQAIAVLVFNVATVAYTIARMYSVFSLNETNIRTSHQTKMIVFAEVIQIKSYERCANAFLVTGNTSLDADEDACTAFQFTDWAKVTAAATFLNRAFPVVYTIIGLMILFCVVESFLTLKAYQEYGWKIFQEQGASIQRKMAVRRYHLFILFLKTNIYFSAGIVVQMAVAYTLNLKQQTRMSSEKQKPVSEIDKLLSEQKTRNLIALPSSVVLVVAAISYYALGWLAVRRVSRRLMYSFLVVMGFYIAGILSILIIANTNMNFKITKIFLSAFATVQSLLNIATFINGIYTLRDFEVLREVVSRAASGRAQADPHYVSSAKPQRLELD
ncbi:hypothetical protein HK104_000429 [Borealophlyctis nickersoniae]|nr:hypothetical protein HK104_000429 [Borealophlyctis nickersoniae]